MNIPPSFLLYDVAEHHLRPATETQMVIGLIRHHTDIYSQQDGPLKGCKSPQQYNTIHVN